MGRRPSKFEIPESILDFDFQELYPMRYPDSRCPACPPKSAHPISSFRSAVTCSAALLLDCDMDRLLSGKAIDAFSFKGNPGFEAPWTLGKLGSAGGYHFLVFKGQDKDVVLRFDAMLNMRLALGNAGTRHFIHGYGDGGCEHQMRVVSSLDADAAPLVRTCDHAATTPNRIWNDCGIASIAALPFSPSPKSNPGLVKAKNSSPVCGNPFLLYHMVKMMYAEPALRSPANATRWLFGMFKKADEAIPDDGKVKKGGSLDERFSGEVPAGLLAAQAACALWDGFFSKFGSGEAGWEAYRDCFFLSAFEDASPLVKTPPSTWNAEAASAYVKACAEARCARLAQMLSASGGAAEAEAALVTAWG